MNQLPTMLISWEWLFFCMGWLLGLVAVSVLALAIIGIGPFVFLQGVYSGFRVLMTNLQIAQAVGAIQAWIGSHSISNHGSLKVSHDYLTCQYGDYVHHSGVFRKGLYALGR